MRSKEKRGLSYFRNPFDWHYRINPRPFVLFYWRGKNTRLLGMALALTLLWTLLLGSVLKQCCEKCIPASHSIANCKNRNRSAVRRLKSRATSWYHRRPHPPTRPPAPQAPPINPLCLIPGGPARARHLLRRGRLSRNAPAPPAFCGYEIAERRGAHGRAVAYKLQIISEGRPHPPPRAHPIAPPPALPSGHVCGGGQAANAREGPVRPETSEPPR
jgi:hypothetical protein